MKKVYIAAPMFSYAELTFNEMLACILEKNDFDVFLPQRSGYKMVELMKEMSPDKARKKYLQKTF